MSLPSRLTFYNASYAFDGGTTTLYATDEQGAEHRVVIPRSIDFNPGPTIGRLHFDGELVPVRSLLESNLLRLFKEAELAPDLAPPPPGAVTFDPPYGVAGDDLKRLIGYSPEERFRRLVDSVIDCVESDAYGSQGTPSTG